MDGTRSYPEDVKFVVESNSRLHPKEKPAPKKQMPRLSTTQRVPRDIQEFSQLGPWGMSGNEPLSRWWAWTHWVFGQENPVKLQISWLIVLFPLKKANHFSLFHAIPPFLGHTQQPVQAANCPWCRRRWYVQSACAPHHPSPIPWQKPMDYPIGLGNIHPKVMMFPCF